jgi:hypothetical protein
VRMLPGTYTLDFATLDSGGDLSLSLEVGDMTYTSDTARVKWIVCLEFLFKADVTGDLRRWCLPPRWRCNSKQCRHRRYRINANLHIFTFQ